MPNSHPYSYEDRADQIYLDKLTELARCGDQEFYAIDEEIAEYFARLVPIIRLDLLLLEKGERKREWYQDGLLDGLREFHYKEALAQAKREKRPVGP